MQKKSIKRPKLHTKPYTPCRTPRLLACPLFLTNDIHVRFFFNQFREQSQWKDRKILIIENKYVPTQAFFPPEGFPKRITIFVLESMTCFFCLCPSRSDYVRQCDSSQWFFGPLPLGSQPPLPLAGGWLAQIPGQMVTDWHWLSWPGLLSWHPRLYGCLLQISCHQLLQPCVGLLIRNLGLTPPPPLLCPWGISISVCLLLSCSR